MSEHSVGSAARHMGFLLFVTLFIPGALGLALDLYLGSVPLLTVGVSIIGMTLATVALYTYSARRLRALAESSPKNENNTKGEEDSP